MNECIRGGGNYDGRYSTRGEYEIGQEGWPIGIIVRDSVLSVNAASVLGRVCADCVSISSMQLNV